MMNTVTIESVSGQCEAGPGQKQPALLLSEAAIWLSTRKGSRCIYGDLEEEGLVIEWHNFELPAGNTFECSRGPHSSSLELCLNLAGHGFLQSGENRLGFEPLTAFMNVPGNRALRTWRKHGERHRFLTVNFSARFLHEQLTVCDGVLHPPVKEFVQSGKPAAGLGELVRLTAEHERLISMLLRPQCAQGACQIRSKGIALQLMADFLVKPCCGNESSCDRQKCMARERVRGVTAILQRDLADPPTLEEIGHEVGCSPFHLSRTFSRETGMTIPQCLRTLRMRYAAELLKSGKCNVTEAAMAVGYSSLSHFSQAFCQTIGCRPALYSSKTPAQMEEMCAAVCSATTEACPIRDHQLVRGPDSQIDVLLQSIH
jgi:AraC-like DNA-binding protein